MQNVLGCLRLAHDMTIAVRLIPRRPQNMQADTEKEERFEMKCRGSTAKELRQILTIGRLTFTQREMVIRYLGPKEKAERFQQQQGAAAKRKRNLNRAEEAILLAEAANRKASWALAIALGMLGAFAAILASIGKW